MNVGRFAKFHRLFELVYQLIILNFLFILGIFSGGVIFGILPSAYSLVQGIKRIDNGEEILVRNFFRDFKKSFISIHSSYFKLLMLIVIWFIQFVIFRQFFYPIYFNITGVILLLLVIYAINTPLHRKNNLTRLVGILLINPKLNFYLLLLSCVFLYINEHVSGLSLFLSFSVFQYFFEKAKKMLLRI